MPAKLTWRGFVSLTILISGFFSAFTGFVLYFIPQGRIARWILWEFLGLSKDAWGGVHILSSYLFVIFFVLHFLNNWKSIKNYFVTKAGKLNQTKQIVAAIVISAVIVISGAFQLYPLQYVIDFGEYLKGIVVTSPDIEPPFGHAEEISLAFFCRRMDINLQEAAGLLKENGIEMESNEEMLSEIARKNGTSPMELYLLIKRLEELPVLASEGKKAFSDQEIEKAFSKQGQGRKSIADISRQVNLPVKVALQRLEAKGIKAVATDKLKDLKGIVVGVDTATDVIKVIVQE